MTFLTFEKYSSLVNKHGGGHWTIETIEKRWDYHNKVIELIKSLKIDRNKKVLEMGTMGVNCIIDSDTIDYAEHWDFEGKKPTYLHDCRAFPWPVDDRKYDLLIALRVFQHLYPFQGEAFRESKRIASKLIIVVPRTYNNKAIPDSRGITYNDFIDFNNGIHPNLFFPTKFGDFYFWDHDKPSQLNIENLFKDLNSVNNLTKEKATDKHSSFFSKGKNVLKKIIKKIGA